MKGQKRKPGRPTLLTAALQKSLVKLISGSIPPHIAAKKLGIAERTFREWRELGRTGAGGPEHAELEAAIVQAEANGMAKLVETIIGKAKREKAGSRTLLDLLSRRFPDEYANTERVRMQVERETQRELESALERLKETLAPEEYRRVIEVLAADEPGAQGTPEAPVQ